MSTTAMVHVRIDEKIKVEATETLAAMGLSISDAVRLLLVRIASEHALPFEIRVPNAKTRAAMKELKEGKGRRFNNVDALMADLNEDD